MWCPARVRALPAGISINRRCGAGPSLSGGRASPATYCTSCTSCTDCTTAPAPRQVTRKATRSCSSPARRLAVFGKEGSADRSEPGPLGRVQWGKPYRIDPQMLHFPIDQQVSALSCGRGMQAGGQQASWAQRFNIACPIVAPGFQMITPDCQDCRDCFLLLGVHGAKKEESWPLRG